MCCRCCRNYNKTTTLTTKTTTRVVLRCRCCRKKTRDCRSKKLKVAFRPRKRHLYDANHGIYGRLTPFAPKRDDMKGMQERGGLPPSQEATPKEIFMFNLLLSMNRFIVLPIYNRSSWPRTGWCSNLLSPRSSWQWHPDSWHCCSSAHCSDRADD